jgi:membrane protein
MNSKFLKLSQLYLLWIYFFFRFATRSFYQLRGLQTASSLAYTTLLSLAPLITVVFGFLGMLPVFANQVEALQTFIFNSFVPAFGDTIREYLNSFSSRASGLTITGIIVLVIIALMLMATIDNAFNIIWHVRSRRNPAARFLVYWTILTLGPLLLGIGLLSTSYLFSLQVFSDTGSGYGVRGQLLAWLPFITTAIAFTLLYVLTPNCKVELRHALTGGILSAVLFEIAKYYFGVYVKSVPSYQDIYGAIAVIPVFLIWLYISWVIVILGAHVTFCLAAFRFDAESSASRYLEWNFIDVCRIVLVLRTAQIKGEAIAGKQFRRHGIKLPLYQINTIMAILAQSRWVHRTGGDSWLLTRDMSAVTLLDLYRIFPDRLVLPGSGGREVAGFNKLDQLMAEYHHNLEELLAVTVASIAE